MDPTADAAFQHSNTPDLPSIDVAAGLIFRDGRLLIAQRHPDSHLGGLWEFPGGKREPNETFEAALVRELQEELGVTVAVQGLIETVEHDYPGKRVRIRFFTCRILAGEPRAVDCHTFKWIRRSALHEQPFPEADRHLLDRLTREDHLWAQVHAG